MSRGRDYPVSAVAQSCSASHLRSHLSMLDSWDRWLLSHDAAQFISHKEPQISMLASTLTVQRLIMAFFCAPGKTTWPATIIRKKSNKKRSSLVISPLGSGQLATGRCTETTGMPPSPPAAAAALSNEPVSRQQGGCSEDEKIFAFGLLPSKLAFILPSRAFYFLYWRANGDLDSTLQCRLRCRETSFRGG